jgi:hypothetical protein
MCLFYKFIKEGRSKKKKKKKEERKEGRKKEGGKSGQRTEREGAR